MSASDVGRGGTADRVWAIRGSTPVGATTAWTEDQSNRTKAASGTSCATQAMAYGYVSCANTATCQDFQAICFPFEEIHRHQHMV